MTLESALSLLFAVVVLAVFAALWLRRRLKVRRASTWPTAPAHVASTAVRLEQRGQNQSIYAAEVRYTYEAGGELCSGSLRRTFLMKGSADRWIDGLSSGLPLVVRYDAGDVRDSVILESDQANASAAAAAR